MSKRNILLMFLIAASSAWAGQAPLTVEVAPLLGENRSRDGWVPMNVTLINHTNEDMQLNIELGKSRTLARRSVVLPRGLKPHSYILYAFIDGNWRTDVRVYHNGRLLPIRGKSRDQWSSQGVLMVGMVRSNSALTELERMSVPDESDFGNDRDWDQDSLYVHPVNRSNPSAPELLPDHFAGYHCVDLVLLNDCALDEFTPAEQDALLNWVRLGGAVVLSPGADEQWLQSDFVRELVQIDRVEKKLVDKLMISGEELQVRSAIHFYDLDIPGASWWPGREPNPKVAAVVPYGLGSVTVLAIDVSEPDVCNWRQYEWLWKQLLIKIPGNPNNYTVPGKDSDYYYRSSRISPSMTKLLSVAKMPSVALVGALICTYLLIAGPVNFIVLRRRKWLVYMPLSIALIATVYVATIFASGYVSKGTKNTMTKFAVVQMLPGSDKAYVRSYFGVFASTASTFNVTHDAEAATVSLHPDRSDWLGARTITNYAGNLVLADRRLTMWSMGYFASEGIIDGAGQVAIENTEDGQGVRITNNTQYKLTSVHYCRGSNGRLVGDLIPGASAILQKGGEWQPVLRKMKATMCRTEFEEESLQKVIEHKNTVKRNEFIIARMEEDPMEPSLGTPRVSVAKEAVYLLAWPKEYLFK